MKKFALEFNMKQITASLMMATVVISCGSNGTKPAETAIMQLQDYSQMLTGLEMPIFFLEMAVFGNSRPN